MEEKKNKKRIVLIVSICLVVVALVIVFFIVKLHKQNQVKTNADSFSYYSQDGEGKAGQYGVIDPNNPNNTVTNTELDTTSYRNSNRFDTDGSYIKNENGHYVLYSWADGAEVPVVERADDITGAYYVVIDELSSTPYLYYFKNGIYQPNYNGMATSQDGELVYIHKGKVDPSYEGLIKYKGYTWYVKNGLIQSNYTGNAIINGKTYFIQNGTIN